MIVKEKIYIPSPSDFTINIAELRDDDNNVIDVVNSYVRFIFYDNTGASYECIHDPFEGKSKNTALSQNGDAVSLFIENYHLKFGELRYRIETKNIGANYPDGANSVFSSLQKSGIVLV